MLSETPLASSTSRSSSKKGRSNFFAEQLTDSRLAGATQPDKRDPLMSSVHILLDTELLLQELARLSQLSRIESLQKFDGMRQFGRPAVAPRKHGFEGHPERLRNLPQDQDRRVAGATFQLCEKALGNPGMPRKHLPRHAPPCASCAYSVAQ